MYYQSAATCILELQDFYCLYSEKPLFMPCHIQIHAGEVVHIRAANGGGKTTLLRTLSGFAITWEGRIYFRGKTILPAQLRQHVVYMNDQAGVFGHLNLLENIEYMLLLQGIKYTKKKYIEVLATVGLEQAKTLLAYKTSKGQKKRLHLARLMLSNSPIWLLDEPFDGLDSQGKRLFAETLANTCQSGTGILLSSHFDIDEQVLETQSVTLQPVDTNISHGDKSLRSN